MITLSKKWASELATRPETGMGYQITNIVLKDGRTFHQVVIVDGQITKVRGLANIPFSEEQIENIIITHDKWDFNRDS